MQKRNYHHILLFLLWGAFLILTVAIVFLSLQDGVKAKEMMKVFMEYAAQYVDRELIAGLGNAQQAEYLIRQAGRAGAFFLLGVLGTAAVHITFQKCNWFFKTVLATGGLLAIAYLTEKVKEYLPTRHFSEKEMLISIASVIAGFLTVSFITFFWWIIKGIMRLICWDN